MRLAKGLPFVACLVVALLGAARLCEKTASPRWSPGLVLLLAALFRLAFVFRPPELSDDLHRYLWDGESQRAGRNPYALAPSEVETANDELRALRERVNHPELVTIYPPAAQLVFRAATTAGGGAVGMKLCFVALDLLSCLCIGRLLRGLGLPPWRLALYAWHPLPILEIAGSGHVDGVAVFASLLAIAAAGGDKLGPRAATGFVSGLAMATATLTKFFPVAFVPGLVLSLRRRQAPLFAVAFLAGLALLSAHFWPELRRGIDTLRLYAENWEFGGFLFRTLRHGFDSGETARRILAAAFLGTLAVLVIRMQRETRPADADRRVALARHAYGVAAAFLLLSPTVYAWYALPLAAWLPVAGGVAGFALSGSVFLGYLPIGEYARTGKWVDSDGIAALIFWLPIAAWLLRELWRRRPVGRSR